MVEHVFALRYAQEARTLLKRPGTELGDLEKLSSRGKYAVFLAEGDDVFGDRAVQTGYPGKERRACGIEVDADRVDAVLHHAAETFVEPLLRHIVLVLSHADRLGVDLHKLRKRILQPARNGHGGAEVHVKLRKLLGGKLAGRVDGRTGFTDDHVGNAAADFADQLDRHLLRLARGGAVADGNVRNMVALDQLGKNRDGVVFLPLAEGRIDDGGVKHLARAVHNGDLAAVGVAGVEPHGHMTLDRRLHQKRLEVEREHPDRALGGGFREGGADFVDQRRHQKTRPGVVRCRAHESHRRTAGLQNGTAQHGQGDIVGNFDADLEKALLLAAVDGKDLMSPQFGKRLGKFIVQAVNAVLVRGGFRRQCAAAQHQLAQAFADRGVVADPFSHDIPGSFQRGVHGFHALFRIDIILRGKRGGRAGRLLREKKRGERLKTLFPGDRGACAALGLVGTVEVLDLGKRSGAVDGGGKLRSELALLLDRLFHALAALLHLAKIRKTLLQRAQRGVVHRAVHFLAVARDKGDGVSLVQQRDDVFDMRGVPLKLAGEGLNNGFHRNSFLEKSAQRALPLRTGCLFFRYGKGKLALFVVKLLHFILRFAGDVDAQALVKLDVFLRNDDGEVRIAAAQRAELLLREVGKRIRQRRDRQRKEHLVGVQARVVVPEIGGFEVADRLEHLLGDQLKLVADAAERLERIEQQRGGGAECAGGLAGDERAVRKDHCAGGCAGGLRLDKRGADGGTDLRCDACLLHHKLELPQRLLVRLAADMLHQRGVVAAQDLHARRLAAGVVIDDAVACHVDAHVGGRLVGARAVDALKYGAQHGEDLHIAVVVDGRLPVSLKVERVDHIHVVEIGGRRLIGEVHGVLERQIPDGEGLELGIAGCNAVLMLMVELAEAGRHLAAAGTRRGDDHKGVRRFDIIVFAEAFVTDDMGNVGGVACDGIVAVVFDAELFQTLDKRVGGSLSGILRDHDAADKEPKRLEGVHQTQAVVIISDAEVAADLVFLYVIGIDCNDDLHIVLELLKHADLAVGLKAGQHAGGMKIIEQLTAELKVQFAAELGDALADMLGLHCQILVIIKSNFCHRRKHLFFRKFRK